MSEWFGRSVIRSCVKLSYEHAQVLHIDFRFQYFYLRQMIVVNGGDYVFIGFVCLCVCHSPLTIKCIFIDCTCFGAALQRYLRVDTLKELCVRVTVCLSVWA